jgi:hypothetical protein
MRSKSRAVLWIMIALGGCATPSRSEMAERDAEVKRLTSARAVHMPKGVESCVGVTLRLTDPAAEAERAGLASLVSAEEIAAATAGAEACRTAYLDAVAQGLTSAEPIQLAMSYGIDPDGKVCAVVEKERAEPIDPTAGPLLDQSAECLKNALFSAQFPAGRVKEKQRIVLTYKLAMDPVETTKAQ